MPTSPTPPQGTPPRGNSSRRAAPTKVGKPFPWGTVVGSVVLAVALIGVVAYAAVNQGAGVSDVRTDPDNNIKGVVVTDEESLTRNHVQGPVDYPLTPPTGGDHNIEAQQCAVYPAAIAPEHAVHSLEHGAVWITYDPSLADDQVSTLADKVGSDPYLLLSPLPGQDSPIIVTAWGRQLPVESADDSRVDDFITAYRTGPQTPEPGVACSGVTTTGPLQPAAPSPAAG